MEKSAIQSLVYGGLTELIKNDRYYYRSSVGAGYSHFTDNGQKALIEYMNMVAFEIHKAEEESLNNRAKQMVIEELKK